MEFNNQISVLTQHNWNTWKHDMQLLMHYGCWQFIIQTKPDQLDEEATYKEKLDLQLRIPVYRATNRRWKEEDFRVVKIEAELILEANLLQLMKQDLRKRRNLSSFTSKKSVTWCYGCSLEIQMARMITKKKGDLKPITNMKMSLATEDKGCPEEGNRYLRFRVKYMGSFHEITLSDDLFNPKLRRNLLSGSRLESKGAHFVGTKDFSEQQEALMVEVTIPNTKQAIRSRDASKWHDAMDKEINVMMERKVWDLVDRII
ncbi:uncharacterized protein TNCV_2891591 [Trichonephila clavipes]|nr:uncharacterized protein TNCV_2891591 [Trichonephila clavipes]